MRITSDDRLESIRKALLKDGINFALVMRMSDNELAQASEFDDYRDYNLYMSYLAQIRRINAREPAGRYIVP